MRKILWSALLLLGIACHNQQTEEKKESNLPGNALATQHCGSCHAYVSPDQLPKAVWEKHVLPAMGFRMGIFEGSGPPDSLFEEGKARQVVQNANIYPLEPILAQADWEKIVNYYLENSPETLAVSSKEKPIQIGLPHFTYKPSQYSVRPPLCTMVKIIPERAQIAFSDGKDNVSRLVMLNQEMEKQYEVFMPGTPVDYQVLNDTAYLTTIGKKVFPSDHAQGVVEKIFSASQEEKPDRSSMLLEKLQRPVHVTYSDLNLDGRTDILVCDFGNLLGKLAWYENMGYNQYNIRYLKKEPGATLTVVKDIDEDGLPDIIALMAQAQEGIFLFKNSPGGFLKAQPLLTFSPLNGSTYFELVDFNQDGHLDILYTCGDNADTSPVLKDYHGIYIYLNDGNFQFKEHWFYPLNGAYKALARDFDQDGDMDIAAISFFPDYSRTPEESFVYLQNGGEMDFTAFSFPESTAGRWMVMDANDMDQDGDIDLALGAFVSFFPEGDITGLYQKWIEESPSVVLLENTIRK
ncbi:VCBS repeat-containing protein [Catalinimonas sp. 4WD22]|uniref:FG-GAP repeat domain-containing protein n=1 Tax=Catalinimonas locisalis TaxID=3133978 RepID=UPI003100D9A1